MEFDPPKTKTERINHYYMMDAMRRFEWDMHHTVFRDQRIPKAWHEIAAEKRETKTKVTIALDDDVIKFFKSMGPGYQPRINDVLRSFMHMKLRGMLNGSETVEEMQRAELQDTLKPKWGQSEAEIEGALRERAGR